MTNGRSSILDVTEEKIFETFGRPIPVCDLLREARSNSVKSINALEQAMKKVPKEKEGQVKGLEIILNAQRANLGEMTAVLGQMKC